MSEYKRQLCNQLDSITKLERSGYGIPRAKRDDYKASIAFVMSLVAVFALYLACV